MRLWHKDLIPVLPRQQLLSQWRECCCIAQNIAVNGTPNHLLVNKVLKYPEEHFWIYTLLVYHEMKKRGYSPHWYDFQKHYRYGKAEKLAKKRVYLLDLFARWHNDRYLRQCYYNLQEKYDCGGISEEEWKLIENRMEVRI